MTVHKDQKNTTTNTIATGNAVGGEDEKNQLPINDNTPEEDVASENNEGEIFASYMGNYNNQNSWNEPDSTPGESWNKFYFGEWSGAEHLYRLVTQSEESDEDFDWSELPPSPPPPEAFGINLELSSEQQEQEQEQDQEDEEDDEDMDDLVQALDSIMLSQPMPEPRDIKEDIIEYLQLDFYTYKEAMARTSKWIEVLQMADHYTYFVAE